jgi:DNA-binding CsgD family transcriptional regulator
MIAAMEGFGASAFNFGFGWIDETSGVVPDPAIISTLDPGWLQLYADQHYDKDDRLVKAAVGSAIPLFYSDVWGASEPTERQREMETLFGFRSGFIIPVHLRDRSTSMMSVGFDMPEPEFRKIRWEALSRTQVLATFAHDRLRQMPRNGLSTAPRIPRLSIREIECLRLVSTGKSSWEVGVILGITERTVKKHMASVMRKFDVRTRAQAIARVVSLDLLA